MSDEASISTPQDRSPKYPRLTLERAVEKAKAIYDQAGKAAILLDAAAKVIGYSNAQNGKAQATFAALLQYGLAIKDKVGGKISVSPLAIRIFHPINAEQKAKSLAEAALNPPIFSEIHNSYQGCSETVIGSHLVQKNFTPEGAQIASATYRANVSFASLDSANYNGPASTDRTESENVQAGGADPEEAPGTTRSTPPSVNVQAVKTGKTMLAQYSVPLGANEATITFTGEKLFAEDFDALADYVGIFKKQFERKLKVEGAKNLESNIAAVFNSGRSTGDR